MQSSRFTVVPAQPGSRLNTRDRSMIIIAWRIDGLHGTVTPITVSGLCEDYSAIYIDGQKQ
jgi:hypothetical protein